MYNLIHNNKNIIYFGTATGIATPHTIFTGTQAECEAEILRLDLKRGLSRIR